MDIRSKIIDLIKTRTNLDDIYAEDCEKGIYNWTIIYADEHKIIKNWNENKFRNIYLEKARSVITNLDKNSYIKNTNLLNRLNEREFLPHEIPFMKPENLFPDKWKDTAEHLLKKYEHAYENKLQSMTDMVTCGKCKKKEIVYFLSQTRSGDEMCTQFFRCISCGNQWKVG